MRDVNSLKGMHSWRTRNQTRKRPVHGKEASIYLDLYMLDKEKERLLKEDAKLSIRKAYIIKRVGELDGEMNKLQRRDIAGNSVPPFMSGNSVTTPWECIPETSNQLLDFHETKTGWKKIYLGY